MLTRISQQAFDRGVAPVFQILTREQMKQVVAYRGGFELQQRIEGLATKCERGELTHEERTEYEAYVRL